MIDSQTKILICYNEPVKFFDNYIGKKITSSTDDVDTSESEHANQIGFIITSLQNYFENIEVLSLGQNIESFISKIKRYSPDVIFNLVESVNGISYLEAFIAGLYELLQVNYTGNAPICLATCLDKSRTKQILASNNIKVPGYHIAQYKNKEYLTELHLEFPVILKLLKEDASIGISELSVVDNIDEVNERLEFLYKTYKQDVLIEEYINGREFNVAVLGGMVLPVSEIDFTGLPKDFPKIVTYEGKWSPQSVYFKHTNPVCPADINDNLKSKLENIALKAYKALNCRDYARVDIRLNKNNTPFVIEVNPNPDLSTDAGFARASGAANMNYPELLKTIVDFAIERKVNDTKVKV